MCYNADTVWRLPCGDCLVGVLNGLTEHESVCGEADMNYITLHLEFTGAARGN